MTNQEKLEIIADILELEPEELNEEMVLDDIETWDSVAVLSVISVMNEKFNRFPHADQIKSYKTVKDLMMLWKSRRVEMEEKILEILKEIRPEFDFETSTNFVEDGYLDSFDVVTVVSEIEDKFHVLINGLEVLPENFESIEAICNLIRKNGGNDGI